MSTDDDARASLFAAAPSRARPPAAAASRGEAAPARPPPSVAPDAARKNATDELLPPTVDDLNRASLLSGGGGGSRSAPVKPPEPVPAAAPPAPPADDDDGAVEFDFENLNLSAGAGGERGEEALDFGAIDADLTNFAQDGVIREALSRGVDLRLYARTVDAELRSMEMLSIGDYVAEADAIAGLFEQIVGCESVLGDMQRMLGAFQANLGGISAEIRQLQEQSLSLSARMANRKSLNNVLRSFLAKVSVPELLIEAITEGTMDDAWFATHLRQLSEKLAFTYGHQQQQGGNGPARSAPSTTPAGSTGPSDDAAADALHSLSVSPFATPAGKDALPNLEKLRAKAVARLREHLVRAIGELARPKQNMQKQQEYALMKSSPGMAFLTDHAPDVAREVRAVYIDTVGRAVADIFKRYSEELARALLPAPASGETVVDVRGGSGASAAAATGAAAVDAFSVAGRLGVLDAAGDPAPPGHVVTAEHSRLPYEALYRSLQRHLVDVAAAEDSFDRRFFGDRFGSDVFTNVIGRPIAVLFAGLEAHIAGSPDAPGIMILVALVAAHRRLLVDRAGGTSAPGAHCLDSYFDRAVLLLWPRFKAILDANIGALRSAAKTEAGGSGSTSALARRLGSPVDGLGAHAVTKRFAEFHASLLVLHRRLADAHASDDMLPRHMCVSSSRLLVGPPCVAARVLLVPDCAPLARQATAPQPFRDAVLRCGASMTLCWRAWRRRERPPRQRRRASSSSSTTSPRCSTPRWNVGCTRTTPRPSNSRSRRR